MSATDIQARMGQAEARIGECNARIAELQEEIARLQEVKPVVSTIKTNLGDIKMELNRQIAMQEKWEGGRKTKYDTAAVDSLFTPYETYMEGVDEVVDSIEDAIKRRESEIISKQYSIGKLRALLNSLWSDLCNFFS